MSIQKLREAVAALVEPQQPFKVGDLVVFKDELKNKKFPNYGEAVVVSRAYSDPIYDGDNSGSTYFHEPLDFAFIRHDRDGDFVEFHADSRRFRKLSDEEIAKLG